MSRAPIKILRLNIILFLRLLLFIPINLPKNTLNWVIISYHRSDLLKDFDAICSSLYPKYTRVSISPYKRLMLINVKVADLIFSWGEANKIMLLLSPNVKNIFLVKMFLFLSIMNGIKLIRFLESKKIRINSLLSLMEMQNVENILVQYFRLSGTKTFSYQHGFYRDTGNKIVINNCNPVNYLASVCDTALTWGEASKNVLERYIQSEIVCTGKPVILGLDSGSSHEVNYNANSIHLVAVLDSSLQREVNISIMKALSQSSEEGEMLSFIAHPDDRFDYSQFNANRISHQKMHSKQHTIVAHNSSAILQYGRAGFKVLLYDKSDFCDFVRKEKLKVFSIIKKQNLVFYDISSEFSAEFWGLFISNYGDECLELILSTLEDA